MYRNEKNFTEILKAKFKMYEKERKRAKFIPITALLRNPVRQQGFL